MAAHKRRNLPQLLTTCQYRSILSSVSSTVAPGVLLALAPNMRDLRILTGMPGEWLESGRPNRDQAQLILSRGIATLAEIMPEVLE